MATYTSNATGLWSAGATWVGGVKPPAGAGHKIVIANTHVVTYDEASSTYGDDTTSAITVNSGGTLKFSRSMSTSLTCRGTFTNSGTVDVGSASDPIPSSYTAVLIGNDSASMANAKYAITSSGTPTWKMWGATRKRLTTLTGATLITDVTFPVADATGWAVGDFLVFGPPSNSSTTITARAITGISGLNITVGAALSEASSTGRYVINISSNVRVTGATPQTYTQATKTLSNATSASAVEIGHVEFVGGGSSGLAGNLIVVANGPGGLAPSLGVVCHNIVSVSGSTVVTCPLVFGSLHSAWSMGPDGSATDHVAVTIGVASMMRGITVGTTQFGRFVNPVAAGMNIPFSGNQSSIANAIVLENPTGLANQFGLIGVSLGIVPVSLTMSVTGGNFYGLARLLPNPSPPIGKARFDSVNFGSGSTGVATMSDAIAGVTVSTVTDMIYNSCSFPSNFAVSRTTLLGTTSNLTDIRFLSVNNVATDNRRYTSGGEQIRENSIAYRGLSSLRFDCWYSANTHTYSFYVSVAASASITIVGAMRYTSTYGTDTPPSVTISGLSATPVVATCPTSGVDTWFPYTLTITNPQSYAGKFTVTYSGKSSAASTGAYCYFDGVIDVPWVESVRHFGYLWDNQPTLTLDSRITLTEAAALALAVSVNHGAATITVTAALTNAQVFQACMADLAQTSNLTQAVHISSTDGSDFTTTYTVVLSGAGAISGLYTDAVGRYVQITAAALVSGSRVQVYNVTTATELYNGVLSGTGLTMNATWTTNQTIRLRADHSTKLPLTSLGTLASTGLSFLDIQEDDTVYADNAVDGATCDVSGGGEFSADGANVQIDINDVDGITSVQRLYAWMQWYQTTSAGIANNFFGAMNAPDTSNYIIDQSLVDIKLDNVSAVPVRIIGGYLSRIDGSTVIAPSSGSIQMDPGKSYVARDIEATVTRTEKWLRNKRVTNPTTGTQTVYDDDGVTVLGEGALYEDVAGSQTYRGQGADRAERLA